MNYRKFFVLLILLLISLNAFAILESEGIKIFAVTEDEVGISADLFLRTFEGEGSVLFVTSNSLVGKDTQTTGNIAIDVASEKTNILTNNNNFIFDIKANASEVDGPSAGAAMALLSYSVLSERMLNPQVAVTGTINTDGSIGLVGGVHAKAIAASNVGIKLFMIPRGSANQVIKDGSRVRSINLLNYGPEELGMKIIEVDTIDDAINYAYTNIDAIEVDAENLTIGFVPDAIEYSPKLEGMEDISNNYIKRAQKFVDDAKKELEVTELDEVFRSSFYPQLSIAERNIELSQIYLDQNYLYSAANYSFNARVLAGAILNVAENPSLLTKESRVLDIQIESLENEIASLKSRMRFIPSNKYEWLIGSQQRIAYAENALNNIKDLREEIEDVNVGVDESASMFNIVYEFSSAKAWIEVSEDFFDEARKDTTKKIPFYTEDFIDDVDKEIEMVENLINDANISESEAEEPLRRLNSAKISANNGFYFATVYDLAFAKSFVNTELARKDLDTDDLIEEVNENLETSNSLTSIWAILFIDHANFFKENALYQRSSGRELSYAQNITTSYDLSELASGIEEAKFKVNRYLSLNELENYIESNPTVDITYTERQTISPLNYAIILVLLLLLALIIVFGIKYAKNPFISDASRAKKLDLILHRLDKAVSKGKITEHEYFFLKKKYEDEFNLISTSRSKRSKITLNLDESRAKLSALQQGLKDLKKHYKAGLIIPEDYERHILEVNSEIEDVKERIKQYDKELRESRRSKNRRIVMKDNNKFLNESKNQEKNNEKSFEENNKFSYKGDNKLKGTAEQVEEEKLEEKEDRKRRRELIKKFNEKKASKNKSKPKKKTDKKTKKK
jgi:predicted S18 family serine protease